MPPRKSNISQATAIEEGGTPTKEREGGTNIEVPYESSYFLHSTRSPREPFDNFPKPIAPYLIPESVPMASSFFNLWPSLHASIPTTCLSPIAAYNTTQPVAIDAYSKDGGVPSCCANKAFHGQDLSLPRTMVQRLAKGVLPPNTSLHKDAVLALSKGATVFINYLAQAAHESNQSAKPYRTIPPAAVLEALHDLEFENFVPRVDAELRKFNEVQTGKRNEYRRKVKEEKTGKKGEAGADGTVSGGEDGEERAPKRVRRSGGGEGVVMLSPEVGDGSEQLVQRGGGGEEDEDEEEEEEEEEAPEEGGSSMYDLRRGKEAEEEEEVEEDEEDEEDEYPDEGRRLSSVEREAFALEHQDEQASGSASSGEEGESD